MPNHVLADGDRNELVAIVNAEGQSDELRQDGRTTRPGLDHFAAAGFTDLVGLLQKIAVDKRTFPNRTCHVLSPLMACGAA